MKPPNFQTMPVDELCELYAQLGHLLATKLKAEKRRVEHRLSKLQGDRVHVPSGKRPRRPYPKVHPKYQNPYNPSQIWAGRGKRPHWVNEMLDGGMSIDDLRIRKTP
jgi:DNA-binding protein H-NS